jgi:hypothetical protein
MISTLMAVATASPQPPRDLEPSLPAALSKFILRLLAKNPAQRPESAQAVARALQEMEEKVRHERTMARHRPRFFERRRRRVSWRIGLAAAVLAGIVIFWPTPRGLVKIESDDPLVEIVFDKNGPTVKGADKEPITLRAGEHGVAVKRGDFKFEADKLLLKKGTTVTLKVELLQGKIQVTADGQVLGRSELPGAAEKAAAAIDVKTRRPEPAADRLLPGSVWTGKRTYRKGWWAGGTVSYELHVTQRNGTKFKGFVFDNGPRRNYADVEGEIKSEAVSWREQPPNQPNDHRNIQGRNWLDEGHSQDPGRLVGQTSAPG